MSVRAQLTAALVLLGSACWRYLPDGRAAAGGDDRARRRDLAPWPAARLNEAS